MQPIVVSLKYEAFSRLLYIYGEGVYRCGCTWEKAALRARVESFPSHLTAELASRIVKSNARECSGRGAYYILESSSSLHQLLMTDAFVVMPKREKRPESSQSLSSARIGRDDDDGMTVYCIPRSE